MKNLKITRLEVSFLTQRFAVKSSPTRLELRARSELDLRIVDVGAVIVLNSIPQQAPWNPETGVRSTIPQGQAELLSQVRKN